jgi:glycine betaine/choline ABC-type transport system substrate-binding protein
MARAGSPLCLPSAGLPGYSNSAVGLSHTTDPAASQYHFVVLADPNHLFPAENVIPIISKCVAVPPVINTLNTLNTLNAISATLVT